jgi:hypothetical protein
MAGILSIIVAAPMLIPAVTPAAAPLQLGIHQDPALRAITAFAQHQHQLLVAATTRLHARVVASAKRVAQPNNLLPPARQAHTAMPPPFDNGCLLKWIPVNSPPCVSGTTSSHTTIALFGDSHAAQWYSAIDSIARRRGWKLETHTKVTCPPLLVRINLPYLHREYTECEKWTQQTLQKLRNNPPSLVVLDMRRFYDKENWDIQIYSRHWFQALARMVATLRSSGSAVLVLGPLPEPGHDVPSCLLTHPDGQRACSPARSAALDADGMNRERTATLAAGGHYLDLTPLFCTPTRCPVTIGDKLVFVDNDHLTSTYVDSLSPVLEAEISSLIPTPARLFAGGDQ